MEGQVIAGKYRLVRRLGQGGMGAVWLAEHLALRSPVAVKLIGSEVAQNPNARARFEREAQAAARIQSAHVVKILDHGTTDDGLPYIAMECLAGESLRERLVARGRLTPGETARVVTHICRALARAHAIGLVHRDLKPENIFIARADDEEIVKILDFGVAKVVDALAVSGMDPTRTGALLGTPYYMSPEQAQGLKTLDHRSDLWSLAVVTFECLTGTRPFTAAALGPLIAKILYGPIPTPSQAAPDARLPAELDTWMARALSREPDARFASAKELSESFTLAAGAADSGEARISSEPAARVLPLDDDASLAATVATLSTSGARSGAMPAPAEAAPDPRAITAPPSTSGGAPPPASIVPTLTDRPRASPVMYVLVVLVAVLAATVVLLLVRK